MSFADLNFIFLFLPAFVLLHRITKGKLRNILLLAGNLVFYFLAVGTSYEWIVILLFSVVFNYLMGRGIGKAKGRTRKAGLICGIVVNSLFLVFFKYVGFVVSTLLPAIFPSVSGDSDIASILLPLGISFYTFKNIGYLHDVYSKKIYPEKSVINYGAYLTLFSQVTMGPIQSYESIRDQMMNRKVTLQSVTNGVTDFIFGLSLKVIFADRLTAIGNAMKTIGYDSISTPLAWIGLVAYSMQLYFDFYGYTLMATGIGSMLGFDTPKNFDYPYTASSMSDFWRRWHMTLGFWFRDHIYIPLGGSRKGKFKTYRNLLIVWLITGIWHGSTWMFLLWGLFLFLIISLEKTGVMKKITGHKVFSHFYMIPLILFSWMIFFLPTVGDLGIYFTRLFPFITSVPESVYELDFIPYLKSLWPTMAAGILFCTPLPRRLFEKIKEVKIKGVSWITIPVLIALFWYAVYLVAGSAGNPFMYVNY